MTDKLLRLVKAIEDTKRLWQDYQSLEISRYLEYLKDLYERELEKLEK